MVSPDIVYSDGGSKVVDEADAVAEEMTVDWDLPTIEMEGYYSVLVKFTTDGDPVVLYPTVSVYRVIE